MRWYHYKHQVMINKCFKVYQFKRKIITTSKAHKIASLQENIVISHIQWEADKHYLKLDLPREVTVIDACFERQVTVAVIYDLRKCVPMKATMVYARLCLGRLLWPTKENSTINFATKQKYEILQINITNDCIYI